MLAPAAVGSGPRLFIAVVTGQNISNLPPIIEYGAPEQDAVLWLESDLARRKEWSKGATRVLRRRGFTVLDGKLLPEEPAEVGSTLVGVHSLCDDRGYRPIWIANGGPKPHSLALNVKQEGRPSLPILYSEPWPAEYCEMPDGITGQRVRRRYNRANLTLDEVLATSEHFIWNEGEALCFWPAAAGFGDDSYGVEAGATNDAHDESENRRAKWALIASAKAVSEPVPLNAALALHPDIIVGWLKSLWGASRNLGRTTPKQPHDWALFGRQHLSVLESVFHGAQRTANRLRLAGAGMAAVARRESLGARFEVAVARRVRAWLEANKPTLPVNEAWINVKVRHERRADHDRAEFDIVLVLANGVLLSLECKTFNDLTEAKDLDARLLNLTRSASQLAQMCVCAPLYTEFVDRPWFEPQHGLRCRLEESGFTFIPFTLPEQPANYAVARAEGEPVAFVCKPFEEHLDRLLEPFVPRG